MLDLALTELARGFADGRIQVFPVFPVSRYRLAQGQEDTPDTPIFQERIGRNERFRMNGWCGCGREDRPGRCRRARFDLVEWPRPARGGVAANSGSEAACSRRRDHPFISVCPGGGGRRRRARTLARATAVLDRDSDS